MADDRDERDVLAAQGAKFAALVAGDLETLADLLDDGLTYVHANGEADDKTQFLHNVAERGYLGVTVERSEVRVLGDVAVVTGLADISRDARGALRRPLHRRVAPAGGLAQRGVAVDQGAGLAPEPGHEGRRKRRRPGRRGVGAAQIDGVIVRTA